MKKEKGVSDILDYAFLAEGDQGFEETGEYYMMSTRATESGLVGVRRLTVVSGLTTKVEEVKDGPTMLVQCNIGLFEGLTKRVFPKQPPTLRLEQQRQGQYRVIAT